MTAPDLRAFFFTDVRAAGGAAAWRRAVLVADLLPLRLAIASSMRGPLGPRGWGNAGRFGPREGSVEGTSLGDDFVRLLGGWVCMIGAVGSRMKSPGEKGVGGSPQTLTV